MKAAEKPPELLPCPLCGKPVRYYLLAEWWIVRCDRCNLRLERKKTEDIAAVWNNRTTDAAILSEAEDLDQIFGDA